MFDTVKLGWRIVHIEELQVMISKNIIFLSQKIHFVLANSADALCGISSGSSLLPKYPFRGFRTSKG